MECCWSASHWNGASDANPEIDVKSHVHYLV